MALSNRDRVGKGFELLAEGLEPFVEHHLVGVVPGGMDWLEWLRKRLYKQNPGMKVSKTDPLVLLRAITQETDIFKGALSRAEQSYAQELWECRNNWAHNTVFNEADTHRLLDTMERLLRAANAVAEADAVQKLLHEHQRAAAERLRQQAARQSQAHAVPAAGTGLKSWREVIRPHPDVASGNFSAAEFAADLHAVSHGQGTGEYGDPVEFFRRTYLTEGLRDLLVRAARRISGDGNAAPVVNLQTNFGGGKTHSLLALYHLFSGRPVTDYPQEVQDLLGGFDLAKLGGQVRRVAMVGNRLSVSDGAHEPDGTHARTIWGHLAWQLCGRDGYDAIAEADRTGTNPGAALTDVIQAAAPCLILIDEWVAYARELYRGDLPAGSFETQFTFAQTLTEAVTVVPGALLVVSIPASERIGGGGSAEEVGGTFGQEALERLQNVVRRVADQWRPATPQESFEIVRRRLFEERSSEASADIAAIARRFTNFYGQHRSEFPSRCPDPDYEARIRAAYPIHPELFDRLYEDWSALDKFQRTRGVLRLMSNVIFALWHGGDANPVIMPGTVPVSDPAVFGEIANYLEDSWKTILDTDVDGPDSTPQRIDQERSTFGQRGVTRRLARTIFLGSAATLKSAHKGIDQKNIWLGTAVPGDTVAHFDSAVHVLADRATYLYSDGSRYWYDTQASVARTAKDEAERLRDQPEKVWAQIVERLEPYRRRRRGNFAAVHVAPDDTGDISDEDSARLVLLHPRYVHTRGDDESDAMKFAGGAISHRGSSQRRHRNMLVFLAPDIRRMEELKDAVREYLAWKHVHDRRQELDLSPTQQQQAQTRRDKASDAVDQRIATSYIWLITPEQPDPARPGEMKAHKVESQSPELAERVSDKLHRDGGLASVQAPSIIHQHLDRELKTRWDKGQISVGELWDLYTEYPYMPRLRDRSVLEEGLRQVLDLITWEQEGFALATGYDDAAKRYQGLAIPHADVTFGAITDHVLLVRPDLALHQRKEDLATLGPPGPPEDGSSGSPAQPGATGVTFPPGGTAPTGIPAGPRPKTRFFGMYRIDSERYARDLTRLQREIIPHLADPDTGELRITVEIEATHRDGFPEDKIRTVTENARVLKFERAEFDDDR